MIIPKVVFDFLDDLRLNNNREWFNDNKKIYEEARQAFETFTADFIRVTSEIDSTIGMPSPKDCMYRIYRDLRFSPDKTPYKTDMCCAVSSKGKNGLQPKYYFSVEPENTFMGGGRYCLSAEELQKVRREICNFPEDIIAAVESESFRSRLSLWDNKLKTFPKGFNTDFVGAEYLKYKAFSSIVEYHDEECWNPDFESKVRQDIMLAMPLNRFLSQALDAPDEVNDIW